MKIKLLIFIISGCLGLALSFNFQKGESIDYKLRVGVSDDTSVLVINHMLDNQYLKAVEMENFIEKYSVSDC
ncbi:MAG: hypothetical protein WBH44_06525 [Proteocatella sp.]